MLEKINIDDIIGIALQAGESILEIYHQDFSVSYKEDTSPLTLADKKAHEIICNGLSALPQILPILSEEGSDVAYEERKKWDFFWLVDPLDGTKEFIKRNGDFTVNIALIHQGEPVMGIVYAPVIGDIYYAKKGEGAFLDKVKEGQRLNLKQSLPFCKNRLEKPIVVASKSHLSPETQLFIDNLSTVYPNLTTQSKGSSLKLCMVAEGSADIYPRLAPTMEWDTAAADAIVRESGKYVYSYDDTIEPQLYICSDMDQNIIPVLKYNKPILLNSSFVVC